ncbi:hypothetical protein B0H12DRAFT_1125521, partial [Mycena haematopus]
VVGTKESEDAFVHALRTLHLAAWAEHGVCWMSTVGGSGSGRVHLSAGDLPTHVN